MKAPLHRQYFVGIMSGTSVDAIDVALVEIKHNKTEFIAALETPFTAPLKSKVLQLIESQHSSLLNLGEIGVELAMEYASAVNELLKQNSLDAVDILAIGCHGQTVFHHPLGNSPFSTQLVNASVLSQKTGIHCIHNFREMDIAEGGQGAPLVPLFHSSLLPTQQGTQVVANLGGIANVSIINPKPIYGFDTGPGNTLIDVYVQTHCNVSYDNQGQLARSGNIIATLLQRLLKDEYFSRSAPKSTGREYFNLAWLTPFLDNSYSHVDILATLVELSAITLTQSLSHLPSGQLSLCGGGVRNTYFIERIQHHATDWQVSSTSEQGINSDSMEAMAFAWLAYRTLTGQYGNDKQVTGADQNVVLGQITIAPNQRFNYGDIV